MMGWGWNGNGDWWWIGGIFMVIFWIAVILLIIWLVRRASGHHMGMWHEGSSNALEIAKTRYAKGEITQEEFDKIKKNLS